MPISPWATAASRLRLDDGWRETSRRLPCRTVVLPYEGPAGTRSDALAELDDL